GVDPTTGPTNAFVTWDPSKPESAAEFNPATKTVSNVTATPEIILGHELIHATHLMEGSVTLARIDYKGLDGSTHNDLREEARTVGVGGVAGSNDITENNLRDMLGINPRDHH